MSDGSQCEEERKVFQSTNGLYAMFRLLVADFAMQEKKIQSCNDGVPMGRCKKHEHRKSQHNVRGSELTTH